jgi:fatty-acyl-CoA synthase
MAAPDRIALKELSFGGEILRTWTYSQLLLDAERLSLALANRHPQGSRVAIYANNEPEWIIFELACALAGLTLVTVNPAFQERELKYVLEQSRSEAIYHVKEFRGNPIQEIAIAVCQQVSAILHRILITDHDAMHAGAEARNARDVKPGDPAQIQYTSGTTGFPKGAVLHHNGLVQNGIDAMKRGGMRAGDTFIHHMPLFHTTGCAILVLGGLGVGATMLLAKAFDPAMIVKVMEREKAQFVLGVPTMLVALIDEIERSGRDVSSVRRIMAGGSMVAPDLCNRARRVVGAPIQIVYGQTECSPVVTQAWYDDSDEDLTQTVGQPVDHTEVSIRSTVDNRIVPISAAAGIRSCSNTTTIPTQPGPQLTLMDGYTQATSEKWTRAVMSGSRGA